MFNRRVKLFDLVFFVFIPIWTVSFVFFIWFYAYIKPAPMVYSAVGAFLICLGLLFRFRPELGDYMTGNYYWQRGIMGISAMWSIYWFLALMLFVINEVRKHPMMDVHYNYEKYIQYSGIAPLFILCIAPWILYVLAILMSRVLGALLREEHGT